MESNSVGYNGVPVHPQRPRACLFQNNLSIINIHRFSQDWTTGRPSFNTFRLLPISHRTKWGLPASSPCSVHWLQTCSCSITIGPLAQNYLALPRNIRYFTHFPCPKMPSFSLPFPVTSPRSCPSSANISSVQVQLKRNILPNARPNPGSLFLTLSWNDWCTSPSSHTTSSFYWNSEIFIFITSGTQQVFSNSVKERKMGREEEREEVRRERGRDGQRPAGEMLWQARRRTKGRRQTPEPCRPSSYRPGKALPRWAVFWTAFVTIVLLALSR